MLELACCSIGECGSGVLLWLLWRSTAANLSRADLALWHPPGLRDISHLILLYASGSVNGGMLLKEPVAVAEIARRLFILPLVHVKRRPGGINIWAAR